ncbi:hypothetical protein B0I35DRAFT_432298 [Stachybotrys elegans]|uniref:Uncharacterized protein n=1 Tax=Stachybotrys elegans TaxID=80388 RepID=A0A8K0SWL0_9HYPO|nr:hypothetical protein B0I35DRAFT_432298 [Stachybotrys elegans]
MAAVQLSKEQPASLPVDQQPTLPRSYSQGLRAQPVVQDSDSDASSIYTDDDIDVSDTDDDNMSTPEPATSPEVVPQLPNKSSLRVNKLLDSLPHKLNAVEEPALSCATPHDVYLSSEEDASSSPDDSDACFDSDDEWSIASGDLNVEPSTARAVSVIFFGKPSIVQLSSRREAEEPAILPGHNHASFAQRMSIISVASSVVSINSPLRPQSSMTMDFPRPQFLESDPFPSPTAETPRPQESMLRKTLKLVKKRSKSRLSTSGSSTRDSLLVAKGYQTDFNVRPQTPAEETDRFQMRRSFTMSPTSPMVSNQTSPSRRRVLTGLSMARGIRT